MNADQKAESATVLTKSELDSWYAKYIETTSNIEDEEIFTKIYTDSSYYKYQNIVENNSYYWLCESEQTNNNTMWLLMPRKSWVIGAYSGTYGLRILVTLSSDALFVSEKVGTKTITGGNMVKCGGDQTYNVWDIVEENHEPSENIKDYKRTETGHTPIYGCTVVGCEETYEGVEEPHTGGTHENGGICTVEGCGYQYQIHGQSSEPYDYKITDTGHTPIYRCTYTDCDKTYEGTEEQHNYENGKCICGADEPEIDIELGKYELLEGYITQIQPETTISTFKNNITTNAEEINIYNHNNELLTDTDIIGTGMKLELKKGTQTKNFTLIVRGDVNDDGASGMADILIINQYRLNKRSLNEIYLKAGDVTDDGKVDFFDIIKINRFKLHKITEL